MSTKKQARAHAIKRQQHYEANRAAKEARKQRVIRLTAILVIVGLVLGGGLAVILIALQSKADDSSTTASSTTEATTGATAGTDAVEVEEGEAATGWGASPAPPDPSLAGGTTHTAVISTSQGDITVELDGAAAPQSVASFLALAGDGFFDQTDCHRLVTSGIFVLQCGDPLGTGTGGPGYRFGPIENAPADNVYPAGTVAMARAGGDAASQGSQFFIVYEDSTIPSDAAGGYTVFGQVVDGLDSVVRVADAGTITGDSDGRPLMSVIVNEVSVS